MKRIGFSEEQKIWILKEHQVGLGAYGRPRMTEEFQELEVNVGTVGLAA